MFFNFFYSIDNVDHYTTHPVKDHLGDMTVMRTGVSPQEVIMDDISLDEIPETIVSEVITSVVVFTRHLQVVFRMIIS